MFLRFEASQTVEKHLSNMLFSSEKQELEECPSGER